MNNRAPESAQRLSESRRLVAALERQSHVAATGRLFPLGHAGIDERLGGGLACGRLHEVFAAESDDSATAASYALMLAQCASAEAPILWVRHEPAARRGGLVFGPGLVELGLDPQRFIFAIVPDIAALLRSADDILRCHQIGALLIEAWGATPALTLTASRRLALAAEKSGVTAFLLRAEANPCPSAAQSRWEVRSLPSTPLEANAPGGPAMEIRLLRHRAGLAEQSWRVEWDRERLCFREPPLSGAVVPLSGSRPAAAGDAAAGLPRWRLSA